jgi:transcription antitermination factor NusG
MPDWVVLELSPQGEDEDPDVLRASLARSLRGSEIFIPASISKVGDSRVVHKLIDNYVFVKREHPDQHYFRMEGSKYVTSVLTVKDGRVRKISVVRDVDIAKMRRQIQVETEQGIEVDDEVEVMSGAYKGIRCKVIEEIRENETVQVYVNLRSKQTIVTLPRSFLKYVPAENNSDMPAFAPFLTRVVRIQELVQRARPPLDAAIGSLAPLLGARNKIEKVSPVVAKLLSLVSEVRDRRAVDEAHQIPSVQDGFQHILGVIKKLKVYTERDHVASCGVTLDNVPDVTHLQRLQLKVGKLAQIARPFSKLRAKVIAGNVLELDLVQATKRISDLMEKVDKLHKIEFQGRAIKLQLSKIETSIRKAEENARKRHH